jgi:hypothetical protein
MLLNDIQTRFRETMLDHPDALNALPDDFAALFNAGEIPLQERLKVYRNNIVGGLTDTLILSFPIVEKLVGRDFMEALARAFILENPPDEGCLNTYGRGFDHFIAGFRPATSLPYLADVAAFEIAMTEAYYAADDTAMPADGLARLSADALMDTKIFLRASAKILSSRFPLIALRDFCLREEKDDDATLDLDQGDARLMVYRPGIEVLIVQLDADEQHMLESLKNGLSLGEALEKTLMAHEKFDVQAFLKKHLALETFAAPRSNTP